jgi:hypothetical protein
MMQRLKDWWAVHGPTRNFLRGWRTRIFAAAVFLLGIVDTIDPYMISSLFGYKYQGLVIMALGMMTWGLREITSTPPGSEGNTESWWQSTAGTEVSDTDHR